jgi:hypothetical protein
MAGLLFLMIMLGNPCCIWYRSLYVVFISSYLAETGVLSIMQRESLPVVSLSFCMG